MSVSVIIPVKNRSRLIGATLDSIFGQSLVPDEVILVDDHSEDDLMEAISPFQEKVRLIQSEGYGPGAARNVGFRNCSGNFVQFFDSDDLMNATKIETQVEALVQSNASIAYGPFVLAEEMAENTWKQLDVFIQAKPLPSELSLLDLTLRGWCSIFQACLFRREILERAGSWREDIMTHEDLDYWIKISTLKPRMIHTPDSLVVYRNHSTQITNLEKSTIFAKNNSLVLADYPHLKNQCNFMTGLIYEAKKLKQQRYISMNKLDDKMFSSRQRALLFAERVRNKWERLLTGTAWERMHGVSSSNKLEDYVFESQES
ncbi:MAG: glycosyltransferase family 2 protein [Cyclobacteriaceae bacterium]